MILFEPLNCHISEKGKKYKKVPLKTRENNPRKIKKEKNKGGKQHERIIRKVPQETYYGRRAESVVDWRVGRFGGNASVGRSAMVHGEQAVGMVTTGSICRSNGAVVRNIVLCKVQAKRNEYRSQTRRIGIRRKNDHNDGIPKR